MSRYVAITRPNKGPPPPENYHVSLSLFHVFLCCENKICMTWTKVSWRLPGWNNAYLLLTFMQLFSTHAVSRTSERLSSLWLMTSLWELPNNMSHHLSNMFLSLSIITSMTDGEFISWSHNRDTWASFLFYYVAYNKKSYMHTSF